MDEKLLKQYLNRTGFQRAGLATLSSAPWYRGVSQPGVLKAPRGFTGMQDVLKYEAPAAGTGIALALRQKDRDKPVTTETEEPKLPEQKPPEDKGSDIVTEAIATEAALRTGDKIKNKITTWEYVTDTKEEFKKLAEETKISFEELEKGAIKNQITFKRISTSNYNVYYDGKEIASLDAMEEKYKGITEYMIKFIGDKDVADVGTGLAESKALVKKFIADGLLDKKEYDQTPGYFWQPLRKTFQEATFDKKGEYIDMPNKEQQLEYQKSLAEKKLKKAHGGLIDKPLTGRSRYI